MEAWQQPSRLPDTREKSTSVSDEIEYAEFEGWLKKEMNRFERGE